MSRHGLAVFLSLCVGGALVWWCRRDPVVEAPVAVPPGPLADEDFAGDEALPVAANPPEPRKKAKAGSETDRLFNELKVVSIAIDVPDDEAAALRRWHWRRGEASRPEARATVREGDNVFADVSVQLKGSAGSFRPFDDEPALTLKFDKHDPRQRFHGLKKLSLNNSVQDPSRLSEKICRELFAAAGIPAPRAAHAFVKLNGRDLGLYVLVEGYNRQFLKRHFANTAGNLFDSGFVQDVSDFLGVNSGDDPEDHSAIDRLIEAAAEPAEALRLEKLAGVLDLDRFFTFVAMESMVCHWDGYTMNRNNYRVFHELDSGRLIFLPHGLDQVFGGGRGSTSQSILPRARGQIAAAVLETAAGRQRFLETVERLLAKVFDAERIAARVDEVAAPIHAALEAENDGSAGSFAYHVDQLKHAIHDRRRSIESQLANPPDSSDSHDAVVLRLNDWNPRTVLGEPRLNEETAADGRPCLVIRIGPNAGSASWRTRIELSPGRYRFEGRVRCQDVLGRGEWEGAFAALSIDGVSEGRTLSGTRGWTLLSQRFRVRRDEWRSSLELGCDLRGTAGEAWFDKQSLRVVRE